MPQSPSEIRAGIAKGCPQLRLQRCFPGHSVPFAGSSGSDRGGAVLAAVHRYLSPSRGNAAEHRLRAKLGWAAAIAPALKLPHHCYPKDSGSIPGCRAWMLTCPTFPMSRPRWVQTHHRFSEIGNCRPLLSLKNHEKLAEKSVFLTQCLLHRKKKKNPAHIAVGLSIS